MSSREWREVVLEDIVDILGDGLHGTPKYDELGEYFFINGNNLAGNIVIDDKTKRVGYEEYLKYKKNLNDRTILISINGTLGNVAVYNGEKVVLGKSACYFNVKHDISKNFVQYVMRSDLFKLYLNTHSSGTTIKNMGLKQMRAFKFDLPSLPEQKAIAATLSCLDDKIELNNRMNKNLEEMAQAIFKSWFVDFEPFQEGEFEESELGLIPKGWRVGTIDEFTIDMKNGGTPSRKNSEYWDKKELPWIKTGEVKNNLIIESEEWISEQGHKNSSTKLFKKNTVLLALYGATAGQVGLLRFDATTNQACCGMTCDSENKALYLFLYFLFNQTYISSLAVGAAQQNLSKDVVSKLKIIIPTDEIFEHISFDMLYRNIEYKLRENKSLKEIRDTLLPKLMSGEVRVPYEEVI